MYNVPHLHPVQVDNNFALDCKSPTEFEPVLSASFWSLPREWISTDPSLTYASPRSVECYDEQLGDKCMTLLLGTW